MQNIRGYNAAVGFAGFGDLGDVPPQYLSGSGPPVYILHGRVYHRISTLLPSTAGKERYGQVYIFDPDEATAKRAQKHSAVDRSVLRSLHCMMEDLPNPYVQHYQHMYEKFQDQEAAGIVLQGYICFRSGSTPDPRRYNEPANRDIAVVFTGFEPPSEREARVYMRGSGIFIR